MEPAVSCADDILSEANLVTLPAVYAQLKAVLDDPDYSMADVVEVVSNDPGITAKLLNLANSAYFGLATKIDTVSRAVSMLGTQEVHDLVLATSVVQSFAGMKNEVMDMQRFWRKSVVCAIAAKELALRCNVLDSDRVFVAGLLRDIGHLFIYQQYPQLAMQAQQLFLARGIPLFQAERSLLGTDYAEVGAEAMRRWNLPETLWEPAQFHVDPGSHGDSGLHTCLVHIAGVVADAFDREEEVREALRHVDAIAWQETGLDPAEVAALPDKLVDQLNSVLLLLLPDS